MKDYMGVNEIEACLFRAFCEDTHVDYLLALRDISHEWFPECYLDIFQELHCSPNGSVTGTWYFPRGL